MKALAWLFLLLVSVSPVAAQSSGTAAGVVGDAFRSAFARTETVPEEDRRALVAYASVVMRNLVTFREEGTATSVYRLAGTEQHIEWRGLRFSNVHVEAVTDTDRANGITRKFSVSIASDGHRTWDPGTHRWSEWRSGGHVMFPSSLHIHERNGLISLANTFHGSFGRGPGSATAILPQAERARVVTTAVRTQPAETPSAINPVVAAFSRPPATSTPPTARIPLQITGLISAMIFIALIVGLLCAGKFLSLPATKGMLGERRVAKSLSSLDPSLYQIHHDLYLPCHDGLGLTQIDHVIVSPFGIFVIETKNYKGWIFGSERQPTWTQQIYRKKSRFPNPLHQNLLHVSSLAAHLGLPNHRFHSLVVFVGGSTFKTSLPGNVIDRGIIPWILSHNAHSLTPPELEAARAQLADLDRHTDRTAASIAHMNALRVRHG